MSMLVESYRVLKEGGKAVFSVWGQESECSLITFLPEILEKYGLPEKPYKYFNFHLNHAEQLIVDATGMGFRSVKVYR